MYELIIDLWKNEGQYTRYTKGNALRDKRELSNQEFNRRVAEKKKNYERQMIVKSAIEIAQEVEIEIAREKKQNGNA